MSTDRDEWVTLTDAQVDALDVGTVVRLTQEDVTITGPLHVVTDYEIIVGRPRGATTWGAYRDGGVQVRPEDVPVDTAAAKGCTCARMDNHRGHRPGGYYITEGCPVHWPEAPAGDQEDA